MVGVFCDEDSGYKAVDGLALKAFPRRQPSLGTAGSHWQCLHHAMIVNRAGLLWAIADF